MRLTQLVNLQQTHTYLAMCHRSRMRNRFTSVVQLLCCVRLFAIPWTAACQAFLSFKSPGVCSNSCPLSQLCHPTISSSVVPPSIFSSHLQSFPASGSFQMSQLFASGGQSIGNSASTSALPMNIRTDFI